MGYLDNAGLYVKIGPETATPKVAGEYRTPGELREIELVLNLTSYPFGATNYIVDDTTVMPAGMRIQEVETYVDTAARCDCDSRHWSDAYRQNDCYKCDCFRSSCDYSKFCNGWYKGDYYCW